MSFKVTITTYITQCIAVIMLLGSTIYIRQTSLNMYYIIDIVLLIIILVNRILAVNSEFNKLEVKK
jgi:hypothetical protein